MKKFVIPILLAALVLGGGSLYLLLYSAGSVPEALGQEGDWSASDGGSLRVEGIQTTGSLPGPDGPVVFQLRWREQYAEGWTPGGEELLFTAGLRYRPDGRLLLLIEDNDAGIDPGKHSFRRTD